MFRCFVTIFKQNIALIDQKMFALCNVCRKIVLQNVKYALFFFSIYNAVIIPKTMYFALLYLKNFKNIS